MSNSGKRGLGEGLPNHYPPPVVFKRSTCLTPKLKGRIARLNAQKAPGGQQSPQEPFLFFLFSIFYPALFAASARASLPSSRKMLLIELGCPLAQLVYLSNEPRAVEEAIPISPPALARIESCSRRVYREFKCCWYVNASIG